MDIYSVDIRIQNPFSRQWMVAKSKSPVENGGKHPVTCW